MTEICYSRAAIVADVVVVVAAIHHSLDSTESLVSGSALLHSQSLIRSKYRLAAVNIGWIHLCLCFLLGRVFLVHRRCGVDHLWLLPNTGNYLRKY